MSVYSVYPCDFGVSIPAHGKGEISTVPWYRTHLASELQRTRRRYTGVNDRALDFTWELKRFAGRH